MDSNAPAMPAEPITDLIAELRELQAKATPLPWPASPDFLPLLERESNFAFAIAVVNAFPQISRELDEATNMLRNLEEQNARAAQRVGMPTFGSDTADHLADEIERLRGIVKTCWIPPFRTSATIRPCARRGRSVRLYSQRPYRKRPPMASNRRLDILCAQHVMGLTRSPDPSTEYFVDPELWDWNSGEVGGECPAYSSDACVSESLLEKMREKGWLHASEDRRMSEDEPLIFTGRFRRWGAPHSFRAEGPTQCVADAVAALRAAGVSEEEIQEAMRG